MARYIDADMLLEHIKNMPWKMDSAAEITKGIFLSTVEEAPTADVAEVIRCKDCKYARGNLVSIGICDCLIYRDIRKGDDFCNYGERKEQK